MTKLTLTLTLNLVVLFNVRFRVSFMVSFRFVLVVYSVGRLSHFSGRSVLFICKSHNWRKLFSPQLVTSSWSATTREIWTSPWPRWVSEYVYYDIHGKMIYYDWLIKRSPGLNWLLLIGWETMGNCWAEHPHLSSFLAHHVIVLFQGAVSPIIPSAPKCSSRHFNFHRKCVCFE